MEMENSLFKDLLKDCIACKKQNSCQNKLKTIPNILYKLPLLVHLLWHRWRLLLKPMAQTRGTNSKQNVKQTQAHHTQLHISTSVPPYTCIFVRYVHNVQMNVLKCNTGAQNPSYVILAISYNHIL